MSEGGPEPIPLFPDRAQRTRDLWEPRYGRPLNDEEVRQITENLVGFFRLLIAWDAAAKAGQGAENEFREAA